LIGFANAGQVDKIEGFEYHVPQLQVSMTPARNIPIRRLSIGVAACLSLLLPAVASAARVYIFRGGDVAADAAVRQAIQDRGHSPNLGIEFPDFDGSQISLNDFDVIVILDNAGSSGRVSAAGKSALRDYLLGGGRVVTAELFFAGLNNDSILAPILPAIYCGFGNRNVSSMTYTQVAPADPIVHNGMPASFTFSLDGGYAGSCLNPVSGAKAFYSADIFQNGKPVSSLVGRVLPSGGRIITFSTLAGLISFQSTDYKRLFVNAIEWAAAGAPASAGTLAVRPGALSFNYQAGGITPAAQSISVSSIGAAVSFNASASTNSGSGWLSISAAAGVTPATLNVSVNPAGLAPGSYSGSVSIGAPGIAARTLTVNLTVATGVKVYIFSGGDTSADNAVSQAIQDRGHSPNLGIPFSSFDGSQVSLTDFDAVVILDNNGSSGQLRAAGRSALRDYLLGGGRVVTAELFFAGLNNDSILAPVLPAIYCGFGPRNISSISYTQVEPTDAIIHSGMPASFTFSLDGTYAGSCLNPVSGAKAFYLADSFQNGTVVPALVGRVLSGGGRIITFSTLAGVFSLQSDDYKRLFVNAVEWAAAGVTSSLVTLITSPQTLNFNYQAGDITPAAQLITVSSSGAAINFNATVSTSSGGGWLSVNPTNGSTPAILNVSVDPSALGPGMYSGSVSITGSGVATQTIAVNFTVTPNCGYAISPASQVFSSTGGRGTVGVVSNSGCSWTAISNAPWLTINSGSSGSGSGTLAYSVAANTAAASRTGTLTIAGQTFTVTQSGTSALFLVGPSPVVFRFKEGTVQPQDQLLFVFGDSPGLSFTETATGGPWLSVAPASGMTPTSPIVEVNPAGLAAGNYQGSVTVRVPNANPAVQMVQVNVFVEAGGPAHLGVDPATGLSFSFTQASNAQTGRIVVSNLGGGSLTFQASAGTTSNGAWLTVSPQSGTATPAAPVSIVVTADPTGLPVGTYTGAVTVSSPDTGESIVIPVNMTVSAVRQTLLLSQSGISFTAVASGGSVPPQTVGVLNIGQDVMNWSASASTLSGGSSWLTVSPSSGSTDAASLTVPLVNVGINTAGLDPGQYYGQVQVSSPTADNSPQFVSVILNVLPAGSDPGPLVRPTGLIFTGVPGPTSPGSQVVTVSNLSSTSRSFTSGRLTTDGTLWFTHLPTEGTVQPSQPSNILVQPNVAGLTGGVRRGVLTLLFADGTVRTVNILLVLSTGATSPSPKPESPHDATGCTATRLLPLFSTLGDQFIVSTSWPTSLEARVVDDCGSPLGSGSVVATFSNGDPPLTMVSLKDGRWTGTWQPRSPASAQVTITLSAEEPGTTIRGTAQLVGGLQSNNNAPQLDSGGIPSLLAPGGIVSIFGSRLADSQATSGQPPLQTALGGASVLLGAEVLPLFSASDKRIDAQVPYDVAVNARHQLIVRRDNSYTVPESVTVALAQPIILSIYDGQTVADQNNPVQAGDTLTLNCSGLGAVDPPVPAGSPAPSDPPSQVTGQVSLTVGGVTAQVISAGLMPGSSGLYQVQATVPDGVPSGDAPVVLSVAGQTSLAVSVTAR
jgi:uncharacterized protein (TIGR03437 family)